MFWLIAAMSVLVLVSAAGSSGAASSPTGQRALGQSVLEPAYNDENANQIGYIKQPVNAPQPVPANPAAWAPIYLVVYPVTSTVPQTTTLLCQHVPVENCPTHGNTIANLAAAQEPTVYPTAADVAGHDHLLDFPSGPDFNIAWEPTVLLFTPQGVADGAVNTHILTDAQIQTAIANGDVKVIRIAAKVFICASVPARLYDMATPLVP